MINKFKEFLNKFKEYYSASSMEDQLMKLKEIVGNSHYSIKEEICSQYKAEMLLSGRVYILKTIWMDAISQCYLKLAWKTIFILCVEYISKMLDDNSIERNTKFSKFV